LKGAQSDPTVELRVESLPTQSHVGSNVGGNATFAGVSDVDACSDRGGDGQGATVVGVELGSQVEGGVEGSVFSDLDVGLDGGAELPCGGVDVEAKLGRDGEVGVTLENVEGRKAQRQGARHQGRLGAEVVLVVNSRRLDRRRLERQLWLECRKEPGLRLRHRLLRCGKSLCG